MKKPSVVYNAGVCIVEKVSRCQANSALECGGNGEHASIHALRMKGTAGVKHRARELARRIRPYKAREMAKIANFGEKAANRSVWAGLVPL